MGDEGRIARSFLEHPQVIQQPAASNHVPGQQIELVSDELQRLERP